MLAEMTAAAAPITLQQFGVVTSVVGLCAVLANGLVKLALTTRAQKAAEPPKCNLPSDLIPGVRNHVQKTDQIAGAIDHMVASESDRTVAVQLIAKTLERLADGQSDLYDKVVEHAAECTAEKRAR